MMRVTFTLIPEDVLALEEYQIKKTRGVSGNQMLGFILAVGMVAILVAYLWPGTGSARLARLFNVLGSVGFPIVAVAALFLLARKNAARNLQNLEREIPGLYQPRTIGLEPEHLVALDATGEGKTVWTAVKDVTQTPERIFILLVGDAGHVIPNRAFASADEASRFAESAAAYWRGRQRVVTDAR